MKTAILPGTFDPFTTGHASLVERGLELFDKIVIAIGINSEKKSLFTLEERILQITECYKDNDKIEVCSYKELTATFAKGKGINFILRGMRTLGDFEYERLLADVNNKISGIETICLFTEPELSYVQSNVVRDLIKNNQDISAFVPQPVLELIKRKK